MPAEEAVDEATPTNTNETNGRGRALVFAGGEMHRSPTEVDWDLVVAADSGYDHALSAGLHVDLIVGDLDSISSKGLAHARAAGVTIEEHPMAKDETDFELALRAVALRGFGRIVVHGGEGGRLSHLLSLALSLADARWDAMDVRWRTAQGVVRAVTPTRPIVIHGAPADLVSLLPAGDVQGVSTTGLRWKLDHDDLRLGTTRGLSNEMTGTRATVSVADGAVIVITEGSNG